MMFFQDGEYPKCAKILRNQIIGMKAPSRVVSALFICIRNRALAEMALSPGTYPRVIIRKLTRNGFWARNIPGNFNGECDPNDVNYVFLNTSFADGVEEGHVSAHEFEKILLHEVVHWGRFHAGMPGEIEGMEAGSLFEYLAYKDKYVGHSGLSCPERQPAA